MAFAFGKLREGRSKGRYILWGVLLCGTWAYFLSRVGIKVGLVIVGVVTVGGFVLAPITHMLLRALQRPK